MTSTVNHAHAHRASWGPPPPYSIIDHEEKPGQPSSQSIVKKIRNTLCGVFASRRRHTPANHANSSVDSLAYAQSDDSVFEAESIDEDNMAWGRPSKLPKNSRTDRKTHGGAGSRRPNRDKEASSIPNSPDSIQAPCRLW